MLVKGNVGVDKENGTLVMEKNLGKDPGLAAGYAAPHVRNFGIGMTRSALDLGHAKVFQSSNERLIGCRSRGGGGDLEMIVASFIDADN